MKKYLKRLFSFICVYVAQWITHQTSNLGIVGSSPIIDSRIFASLAQLVRANGC